MKEIAANFISDTTSECISPILPTPDCKECPDCNTCVIEKIGLAQAFVPTQPYQVPSTPEQSLICGTAFSDLSMPYTQGNHIRQNAREVTAWNAM